MQTTTDASFLSSPPPSPFVLLSCRRCFVVAFSLHFERFLQLQMSASVSPCCSVCIFSHVSHSASTQSRRKARGEQNSRGRLTHLIRSRAQNILRRRPRRHAGTLHSKAEAIRAVAPRGNRFIRWRQRWRNYRAERGDERREEASKQTSMKRKVNELRGRHDGAKQRACLRRCGDGQPQ